MRLTAGCFVVCALAALPAAMAQVSKTLAGETTTVTATVEGIERSGREVTLRKDKAALAKVKVGDRVDITWTAATLLSSNR